MQTIITGEDNNNAWLKAVNLENSQSLEPVGVYRVMVTWIGATEGILHFERTMLRLLNCLLRTLFVKHAC